MSVRKSGIGLSVRTRDTAPDATRRRIEVERPVLARNQELAADNRARFAAHGVTVINVVSSPGSGKTELLARSLGGADVSAAVIVGDLETDRDAERLAQAGVPAIQITTGGVCHLEAAMVARAASELDLEELDLLVIENVGNLVCPASFDLGEETRVVLMSVTEGEDKPLKYPTIFKSAGVVVLTKMDLADAVGFDRDAALANVLAVHPAATVFETSARTGAGLDAWRAWLGAQVRATRERSGGDSTHLVDPPAARPRAGNGRG